ncbi:hypothetical protein FRAHR75_10068 [Frankia sp. Hr75.2]|nr:hypothetical protein FRAHR75_10068 [Frankia sp. Hr75.2]
MLVLGPVRIVPADDHPCHLRCDAPSAYAHKWLTDGRAMVHTELRTTAYAHKRLSGAGPGTAAKLTRGPDPTCLGGQTVVPACLARPRIRPSRVIRAPGCRASRWYRAVRSDRCCRGCHGCPVVDLRV